jgi:hypothetical protein
MLLQAASSSSLVSPDFDMLYVGGVRSLSPFGRGVRSRDDCAEVSSV